MANRHRGEGDELMHINTISDVYVFSLAANGAKSHANKAQIRNDRNGRHDCQVGDIEHEILLHKQRDIDAE